MLSGDGGTAMCCRAIVAQLCAVVTLAEHKAEQSALDVPALCTGKGVPVYAGEKVGWATEPS